MNGRERVLKALKCEETDRTPWVPFVGCHAGALVGATAEDILRSEDLMVAGAREAVRRYKPDGLPVAFDLQIEAEALGCGLSWAKENPPAVNSHPLAGNMRLADLKVPGPGDGRIALALGAARRMRANHPDIALYGLITGPFTLALHLLGTDIFMKMYDEPQEVKQLLQFASEVGLAMAGYYLDAGCDVVAVVDPMTSQIGPDQFVQWVTPVAQPIFDAIRARNAIGSFFVCGHAQQNLAAMCDCHCHNISVDENIPLQFVRDVCLPRKISFGGNMQLTTVLLLGTPVEAQKNAIACLETGGRQGFILSPGCDLPFAVPPANLEAIPAIVADDYQRQVVKAIAPDRADQDRLDLEEYGHADKVVIDIITLDSEACAPCQYMVDAVRKVAPEFDGILVWREHKIKYRESLVLMTSLMVHNVPTICIDGQIAFVSRIPPRDELVAAIQRRINEKLKVNVQRRKATLYVLASDKHDGVELRRRIDRAVSELGADVTVQKVTDPQVIASYGITPNQLPAVVLARYRLKSSRTIPEVAAIKEWIKDL
ncbi:MAG: uroporphyrinogen decarboxylase family protein [bacterium]